MPDTPAPLSYSPNLPDTPGGRVAFMHGGDTRPALAAAIDAAITEATGQAPALALDAEQLQQVRDAFGGMPYVPMPPRANPDPWDDVAPANGAELVHMLQGLRSRLQSEARTWAEQRSEVNQLRSDRESVRRYMGAAMMGLLTLAEAATDDPAGTVHRADNATARNLPPALATRYAAERHQVAERHARELVELARFYEELAASGMTSANPPGTDDVEVAALVAAEADRQGYPSVAMFLSAPERMDRWERQATERRQLARQQESERVALDERTDAEIARDQAQAEHDQVERDNERQAWEDEQQEGRTSGTEHDGR